MRSTGLMAVLLPFKGVIQIKLQADGSSFSSDFGAGLWETKTNTIIIFET